MSDVRANPLLDLSALGQSVWLDYIRRGLIDSGELARLVAEDGVRGVTSNPAIFEKAIASGKPDAWVWWTDQPMPAFPAGAPER